MLVSKVMSSPVISVTYATTVRAAAAQMRAHHVGALPVIQDDRPVGIVTDRDIVLRALGDQSVPLSLDISVGDIMSREVITCFEDQQVAEAAAQMGERQIRRLLVIDRSGAPVGILSLGDIAEHVSEELAGEVLGEVSEARARHAHGCHRLGHPSE